MEQESGPARSDLPQVEGFLLTSGSLESVLLEKRCRQSPSSGSTAQTSGPADSRNTVRAVRRLTWSTTHPGPPENTDTGQGLRVLHPDGPRWSEFTGVPKAQQGPQSGSEQQVPGSSALLLPAHRRRQDGLQGLKSRLDHQTCSTPHQRGPWRTRTNTAPQRNLNPTQ